MSTREHKAKLLEKLAERSDLDDEERAVLLEAAALVAGVKQPLAPARRASGAAGPAAILWSDGAARGNPGPAGIGAVLEDRDGKRLAEHSEYLGNTTNNVAEYRALIAGLGHAIELGVRDIEVRADSQLMIRQLKGEYRVKNAGLKPLYDEAQQLIARFDKVRLVHVPRADNSEADRLANEGIDSR